MIPLGPTEIDELPNIIVLPDRYKSLNAFVALPKSYVTLAVGVIDPLTCKPVNVPTLVMLGCAAVVTVPAVFAVLADSAVTLDRLDPSPTK